MGKTPTDLVERKRSLPVVLAHGLWLQEVRYFLLEDPDGVPFLESLVNRPEGSKSELAKATLMRNAMGIRTKVDITHGLDRRALLMLAHDSLAAAEQKRCLSQAVAQLRPALQEELKLAGLSQGRGGDGHLHV